MPPTLCRTTSREPFDQSRQGLFGLLHRMCRVGLFVGGGGGKVGELSSKFRRLPRRAKFVELVRWTRWTERLHEGGGGIELMW